MDSSLSFYGNNNNLTKGSSLINLLINLLTSPLISSSISSLVKHASLLVLVLLPVFYRTTDAPVPAMVPDWTVVTTSKHSLTFLLTWVSMKTMSSRVRIILVAVTAPLVLLSRVTWEKKDAQFCSTVHMNSPNSNNIKYAHIMKTKVVLYIYSVGHCT